MDILSVLILILSLPGVVFSLLACSERDSERERERVVAGEDIQIAWCIKQEGFSVKRAKGFE